ncbi:MAG: prepilin-type N-terminal cleavage/methylation domain-containing protein [Eubacteriales bacterium]|nr:prepilin-type N-terminal cleavage/methylation domain-containing protein [Eubacteriales bacterium]
MDHVKTKLRGRKGFTLAELLIVVAIIAILIAIAIPTFSVQLEKSRQAVDSANVRSAESIAVATYLLYEGSEKVVFEFGANDQGNLGVKEVTEGTLTGFSPSGFTETDYGQGTDPDHTNKTIKVTVTDGMVSTASNWSAPAT